MGSGLILLGIAGAWLAVLVPMALRSHDSSRSLSSVDRFGDAMRVLARREQQGRGAARSVVLPRPSAPGLSLAARRMRVLLTLSALALVTLLLTVVGFGWALLPHLLLDGLAIAYVAHLRNQAVRKAERSIRSAARPRQARSLVPAHIAGIPDRMPARPGLPAAAPAARYLEPQPGALGETWTAPAVPVPTYVTAPMAPPREPRTVDLTTPGAWSAAAEIEQVGKELFGEDDLLAQELDDELDDIIEPRRASGDW